MSNYKDLVGTAVRNNAGNIPTAETGQVWFDSTNLDFKYQFPNLSTGSWRTGNALNTARDLLGSTGIQTASLVFGGPSSKTVTESYDGTNFIAQNGAQIGVSRSTGSILFTPRRWDETPLSGGELMITIFNV